MFAWARRWGTARTLVVVVIAALVAVGCGSEGSDEQRATFTPPRTYHHVDLGDPAAAVAEFASAFVRRDFVAAMLLLHPSTQAVMATDIVAADFSGWVMPDLEPAVQARIELERGGDHHLDALRVFEIAMEEATLNGGFRVDLAGGIEDIQVRYADGFTAIVDAVLSTSTEAVVFELAPTPDGRGRIRQVRLENGAAAELPFSGRPTLGSPVRNLDVATTWRAGLPNSSPAELLETVAFLVGAGDFFSVYLLLDAPAQRELEGLLPPDGSAIHDIVAGRLDVLLGQTGFAIDLSTVAPGADPPAAADLEPGQSLTFMAAIGETGETGLDVTVTLDREGGWRLHRLAPVGDLGSPVPFPLD